MSLKQQARAGLIWTFLQQFGTQIISFVVGIILARILLPSDFGAIAMFAVVIAVASSIVDGGLASSLIRSRDIDERDLSTVFWFNIGVALVVYLIVFLSAPYIAKFYNLSILTDVIRVYSISIIITSLSTVQKTRLTINFDFKKQFIIQLPSLIVSGLLGVYFAYDGYGIWALVIYYLAQSIITSILFWSLSSWKPLFIFDKQKFKYHFNYGYKLTLSGLLDTIFTNAYSIVIGKYFPATILGYYNRADTLKQLPVSNLSTALNTVTFPLFAKISDDDIKLKSVYKKLMKVVIFIIAPVLCYMVVVAVPLVRFLLTDKWLPIVPYFQILSIAGILYPIHAYNLNVLKVKGRSDLFLWLEIWKKILIVIVMFISFQFGMMGLVWGQVIISVLAFFINSFYTGKIINYGGFEQIKDLIPNIGLSGSLAFIFVKLNPVFFDKLTDLVQIILVGFTYFSLFLMISWLLKFKEIKHIKELLRK